MGQPDRNRETWLSGFFAEVISMPRHHVLVFVIATVLLLVVEVELMEGWRLVHLAELVGLMVFLYLLWAAWRAHRGRARA